MNGVFNIQPRTIQQPMSLEPQVFRLDGASGTAAEVREKFTQFVGETFYGQMIKSMRTTVGKPAYFHGGRAEEVFQGQLDQVMAEHMTEASADTVAEPMFRNQFPHLAAQLADTPPAPPNGIFELSQLSRR